MSDVCPKCGADMTEGYRRIMSNGVIEVPLDHHVDGWRCLRNQLAAVTAERDAAQARVAELEAELEQADQEDASNQIYIATLSTRVAELEARLKTPTEAANAESE